jgi:hypothetical protein
MMQSALRKRHLLPFQFEKCPVTEAGPYFAQTAASNNFAQGLAH